MNNNNNEMKSNVFSDYGNNNQNNISNQGNTPVNNGATVNGVPNQTNINQVGITSNNMGPVTNNAVNNPGNNIMNPSNPQTQDALNTPTMPTTNQPTNQISNDQTTSSIMGTSNTKTTSSNANTYFKTISDNKTNTLNNQIPNQNQVNQIPVNEDFSMPKLNTDETVGVMKKDTQKSPVAMLILFACLIIGIFVIPYITPYLSDVLKIFGIDDNSSIYGDGKDTPSNTNKDNNVNKNIYIAKNSLFPEDNKISHIILAAHSGYNCIAYFKDLNKLVSNDDIYLYYNSKKYTYRVAFSYEIEKNGYLAYNTRSVSDLYLITCLKNTDRQIVYVANLIMEENI